MSIVFLAGVLVTYWAEGAGNANFAALGIDPANMEGKEVRFGIANSSLWAVATTDASNGSVNAMHDSFTPLGGMIPIINMQLGEIIFGGVGSGLYGMLLMVIVAVFVAGLMVGRTPEYLGKKIEAKEVKMAMLAILILPLSMLAFTAISVMLPFGLSSIQDPGPHGFSEMLYLFTSQTANNGSAFAGFTGNTLWYNTTGGLAMLIGRYFVIVPMMAVAGSLVVKKTVPDPPEPSRRPGLVRRSARRRDPHHRRPHVLPRARARADRRAFRDASAHDVLTTRNRDRLQWKR